MQHNRLKSTLNALYEHADKLEKEGVYIPPGNIALRKQLIFDFMKFMLWLSASGHLNAQEVVFVNNVLNLKYTDYEYFDFYRNLHIETSFASRLPDVFLIYLKYENNRNSSDSLAGLMTEVYRLMGISFISCDTTATEDQVLKLTDFVLSLRNAGTALPAAASAGAAASQTQEETKEEAPKARPVEEIMDELNALVGLEDVKKDVSSLINLVQVRKMREERGFKQADITLHMVFSGNPGTGKTTIARLLSELYLSIGLLSKGHLYETDRSGLVAGYVGQTALKVQEAVEKAMGGILFIDEAYALTNVSGTNDFGFEAITTLLKLMEDNRNDLIVIVAGYTDLMEEFLNSNPGLKSRFNKFLLFRDYNTPELLGILDINCKKMNLSMTKKARLTAKEFFDMRTAFKPENYANGRDVRNYFEKAITSQADRLASIKKTISDEALNTIIYADVKDIVLN